MRRFYTAREQLDRAEFWHTAARTASYGNPMGEQDWNEIYPTLPDTIHRGIGVSLPDDLHRMVHDLSIPVEQRAQALLKHINTPEARVSPWGNDYRGGLGTSWSGDDGVAEDFARRNADQFTDHNQSQASDDTWGLDEDGDPVGKPGTAVMLRALRPELDEIDDDPNGDGSGMRYTYNGHGEQEVPVRGNSSLNISGISWRPILPMFHPDYATDPEEYTHHDFGADNYHYAARTAGTPAKLEWRHNLDGIGPEWELIASPPTGRTQVVQTENSGHQHYGATSIGDMPSWLADAASEIGHIEDSPSLPGMESLPASPQIVTDKDEPRRFDPRPSQPYLPGMEVVESSEDTLRALHGRPPQESAAPYGDRLEQTLYDEFMDWWPNSTAYLTRTDDDGNPDHLITTNWRKHPDQPITHWMNVEDFLNERHPEAATGSYYGLEDADIAMRNLDRRGTPGYEGPVTPDVLRAMGYTSLGNVKTQAMLNLHNRLQGRDWATNEDRDRYMRLMLKHLGPQKAARLARLAMARSAAADECPGSGRASKEEHDGRRVECDVCGKTVQITPYAAMYKHPRLRTAASSFTCPPGQPGCVSAMGTPDPKNTQMGPKGERPTAKDYAEPWDANPTAPDYTDYSVYSGVGGGTGGGGSWGGSPSGGTGSVGAGGIMDISRPLHDLIKQKYPDVEIGGYRDDGPGRPSEHQRGSLDIMHPYNHGIDPNWAIQQGFNSGAPWAIWDNQMYYPDGRTEAYTINPGMPNDATQRHEDHIHIGPLMGN